MATSCNEPGAATSWKSPAQCNKREPGSGCAARDGFNREHALFGASDSCVAIHPSDMAVALAIIEATVHVHGPRGRRSLPISEFLRLPGDEPHLDNTLRDAELIVGIELPPSPFKVDLGRHAVVRALSKALAVV